ncbi:MAG TPA: DUF192 domain-containing protein [Acidimicrobiales bacterium]|nr:DUF192 domain-containing protein [Acidimicrobiales bacterium]
MAWLLRRGEVLASLELAESPIARARGFLGHDPCDGALLIKTPLGAHTLGVRIPLDVAYLDADLVVVSTRRMAPNRIGLPRRGVHAVLEAEAGAFERWRLRPGDALSVEG